ncbi:MAG: DUF1266 domain-containing protein [Treponema sp.]|nr:DUF1266 domain-containing protein [Treponema sp.]
MKKNLLLFLIFLFGLPLFAELTKEQFWAISLTGIMTERNNSSRNTLNVDEITDKSIYNWLDILGRDWDIYSREDLLNTLENVENNGHASALRDIKTFIEDLTKQGRNFTMFDIYNRYQFSQRYYNYLKFTVSNWDIFGSRTILAWDLGRNISLCRWGYQVGFLTEEEAWEKIMYYAKKLQLFYNSWEEYGHDYYMGRIFWASGFGDEIRYALETDPIYKKLLTAFWNKINWYTNLNPSAQNPNETAVNTIRYQKPADNDGVMQFFTNDSQHFNKFYYHTMVNPGDDSNIFQCNVKKMSGNEGYAFGIMFCFDNSESGNISYYRLFMTIEGIFTVQKMIGSKWADPPIGWKNSPHIKKRL